MAESHAASTRYIGKVYRDEPETRWFHRVILRRSRRLVLFHAGLIDNFTLQRDLNGITNSSLVFRDPMEAMQQFRLPDRVAR